MISISHVAKTFPGRPRGVTVFRDLSCSIPYGQITGLVGVNGCGKSTLLRLIAGLEEPDAGQIKVGMVSVTKENHLQPIPDCPLLSQSSSQELSKEALLYADPRRWCAWTPETPLLARHLSGHSHLRELAFWSGASPALVRLRLKIVADTFPVLLSFWDRPARVYSRGQAALVALARVIMTPRPVWLLDEPTAGLDTATALLVREWLRSEAQRGRTIVLCTHLSGDIVGLCHQVLRVDDGGVHLDSHFLSDEMPLISSVGVSLFGSELNVVAEASS